MGVIWEPELSPESYQWKSVAADIGRDVFAPEAARLDREQVYPTGHIQHLVDSKLSSLFVPKKFGGSGAPLASIVAVVEEVGRHCASTAAILCTYQLGAYPILLSGTDAQREKYLGEMARGVSTSFALSERDAGSDPAAIKASLRPAEDMHLTGEKYWIGNGGASRYYIVFCKEPNPDGGRDLVSAVVVDTEDPGVDVTEFSDKMGIRGTLTSNLVLNTHIREDQRVGEAGRGLRLAFETLAVGRVLVGAQSLGLAMAAFEEARTRAFTRTTFGKPLIENQALAFRFAELARDISAARLQVYEAAKAFDAGKDITCIGAMAKLSASEAAHQCADFAVQIWGGEGFCKTSVVERLYRDQRILEIYEGSTEIQKIVLSRALINEMRN